MEQNQQRAKRKELGPAECMCKQGLIHGTAHLSGWFCLSNPKVTKHLIVGIGSESYLTLPKGQLIPTTPAHIGPKGDKPLVPGGGHMLVRCSWLLQGSANRPDNTYRASSNTPVHTGR